MVLLFFTKRTHTHTHTHTHKLYYFSHSQMNRSFAIRGYW